MQDLHLLEFLAEASQCHVHWSNNIIFIPFHNCNGFTVSLTSIIDNDRFSIQEVSKSMGITYCLMYGECDLGLKKQDKDTHRMIQF